MTKKEMKIKKDVYNELDIPNVLDRIQPYAENRALELGENNKTIRLDFHRPARLITLGLTFVIVLALTTVFIVNQGLSSRKYSEMSPDSGWNYSNAESSNGGAGAAAPQSKDDMSEEFYEDFESETSSNLSTMEVNSLYTEIKGYIDDNKTLDEIYDIYSSQGNDVDREVIEYIYNYIKNN